MIVKTSELTGRALDFAVGACVGLPQILPFRSGQKIVGYGVYLTPIERDEFGLVEFSPSTDWSQGGPIIKRERVNLRTNMGNADDWTAFVWSNHSPAFPMKGPTPLIAAMRCFVASRLGDEVDIPDQLIMHAGSTI